MTEQFKKVNPDFCELSGPIECVTCGGHLMVDDSFIDQVSGTITCPYCGTIGPISPEVIGEEYEIDDSVKEVE